MEEREYQRIAKVESKEAQGCLKQAGDLRSKVGLIFGGVSLIEVLPMPSLSLCLLQVI
jgi:hypothetical protein